MLTLLAALAIVALVFVLMVKHIGLGGMRLGAMISRGADEIAHEETDAVPCPTCKRRIPRDGDALYCSTCRTWF